jgi:hypothetical protein
VIDLRSCLDLAQAAAHEIATHLTGAVVVPDQAACIIPGREHKAQDGRLICDRHYQELGHLLRDIEDETIDLSVTPSLAVSYDSAGGSAPAFERSPIRVEVSALTDSRRGTGIKWRVDFDDTGWDDTGSVLETLSSWARIVREERHLTAPVVDVLYGRRLGAAGPFCEKPTNCWHESCRSMLEIDTVAAPATVTGERTLLTRHLDWIAQQPWVDDLHTELKELLTQLRRANNTLEAHVGTCGTLQPTGSLCEGKVWHVLIQPDGRIARGRTRPGPHDEPGFRCSRCRRVWTGTEAVRKRNDMWLDEQKRKGQA